MPADLFDPSTRPAPAGAGRRLTVTTSIAIHAAVVLLVIVLPLMGGVSLPAAMSSIDAFVQPPELPPTPVVQPPAPSQQAAPAVNPDAAPLHAPDTIAPEVSAPVKGVPQVPGALPIGPGYGVPGGIGQPNTGPAMQPPPPAEPVPVRAGGVVRFPKRVVNVEPKYPQIAQSARVEGTVILEATIDEQGGVKNLRVLKSIPLLDAAALEAVKQWRYSPTTLNGERVAVVMTVTVTFRLR